MKLGITQVTLKSLSKLISIIGLVGSIYPASADTTTPISIPRASITANELAVIIAEGDPLSEAIGAYYQSARGIPAENIIRVKLPNTTQDGISATDFNVIKAKVDQVLPANIQATLLTWTHPFKVGGGCDMSITSAFALGYDTAYCKYLTLGKSTPYYDSSSTHPWQDFGIRPSMMLGAYTLDSAKALIDRGIQSDGTYPSGDGYLVRTTDVARSVRYGDFLKLPNYWGFTGGLRLNYIDNSSGTGTDYIQNKNAVLFYFTGLAGVPYLESNNFLPGAIGDHLTSYGGILPPSPGQMPSTKWLEAGATGSFGTVEEPMNYQQKFPRASIVIDQYFRGATLIEAYWKSVSSPGEGLFLGEPLARPFADQASSTIESGQYVVKTRSLLANSRYSIEAKNSNGGEWSALKSLWVDKPGPQEFRAPVVANSNTDLRLTGPCPTGAVYPSISNTTEVAQGGRPQRVYYNFALYNLANIGSNCNQDITISIPSLPSGLTAAFVPWPSAESPNRFKLSPQEFAVPTLAVNIPGNVAQQGNVSYKIPYQITDNLTGQKIVDNQTLEIDMIDANATDPDFAPVMRISRPTDNWIWTDFPHGVTSTYGLPVDLDIKPNSGIVKTVYKLQAVFLENGDDVSSYTASVTQTGAYVSSARVYLPKVSPGAYHLSVIGYDSNNAVIATVDRDLYTDIQINRFVGSYQSDVFTGTSGNDLMDGYTGADVLTGGGGRNIFVFRRASYDGIISIITDFKPAADIIDLTTLLSNMSAYFNLNNISDAYNRGLVKLVDTSEGVEIQVAYCGLNCYLTLNGTYARLVRLNGVSSTAINVTRDLKMQP